MRLTRPRITVRLANYEAVLDELTNRIIEVELDRPSHQIDIYLHVEGGRGRLSEDGGIFLESIQPYMHAEGEWTREEAEDEVSFYRPDYEDRAYQALRGAGVSDKQRFWD